MTEVFTMSDIETVLKTMTAAGKPMKAGEISDASGLDRKAVDAAMKALKKDAKIVSPKACHWEPAK